MRGTVFVINADRVPRQRDVWSVMEARTEHEFRLRVRIEMDRAGALGVGESIEFGPIALPWGK